MGTGVTQHITENSVVEVKVTSYTADTSPVYYAYDCVKVTIGDLDLTLFLSANAANVLVETLGKAVRSAHATKKRTSTVRKSALGCS